MFIDRTRPLTTIFVLIALFLTLAGCGATPTPSPSPLPTNTPIAPAVLTPILPPPASPSPLPATPTPPPSPTSTPPGTAVTPVIPPAGHFVNPTSSSELVEQQAAMAPFAKGDIAKLGTLNRYAIDVYLDWQNLQLTARQWVVYHNQSSMPLSEVYFAIFPNAPSNGGKLTISQVTVGDRPVADLSYASQGSQVRVPLPQPLPAGQSVNITLDFVTTVPRDFTGGYAVLNFARDMLALAHWYPIITVFDGKEWHTDLAPAYGDMVFSATSLYTVRLTAPGNLVVIASGVATSETANPDGTVTRVYRAGPVRDFYFIIGPNYQKVSAPVGETTINAWYVTGHEAKARDALEYGKNAFTTFTRRFGTYPFSEFDIVESPTQAGGIEYPGLVILSDRYYTGQASATTFEFVTVHETAHQWWYSLVGDDQVRQPWLDESLANYSTILYYLDVRGKGTADTVLEQRLRQPWQRWLSQGQQDMVVDQPVAAFPDGNAYSVIVYDKGALFWDALRNQLGDEKFNQVMQAYFARYQYKIATGQEFLKLAEEVSGQNLKPLYQEWILGKK